MYTSQPCPWGGDLPTTGVVRVGVQVARRSILLRWGGGGRGPGPMEGVMGGGGGGAADTAAVCLPGTGVGSATKYICPPARARRDVPAVCSGGVPVRWAASYSRVLLDRIIPGTVRPRFGPVFDLSPPPPPPPRVSLPRRIKK